MSDPIRWIEIFKAGKHTSSNGISRNYTPEELQDVVNGYDPNRFKAPLIVSAPAHNTAGYADGELWKSQLAFGYPKQLKAVGDKLLAGFEAISPKVKEWIENGQILGFSSSFYLPNSPYNPTPGKLSLRHVAGCGVDPPAVKGMASPELCEPIASFADYSDDQEEGVVEFAIAADDETIEAARLGAQVYQQIKSLITTEFCDGGYGLASIFKEFYQRQRDKYIEDERLEEADKLYPSFVLADLERMAANTPQYATLEDLKNLAMSLNRSESSYSEDNDQMTTEDKETNQNQQDYSELQVQFSELKTANDLLKAEVDRLTQFNSDLTNRLEREQISSFVDGLIGEGKMAPSERDNEIEFILSLPANTTVSYSDGGEQSQRNKYMKKLEAVRPTRPASGNRLPIGPEFEPASFGESRLPSDVDSTSAKQHAKVSAYAQEHNVSFREALDLMVAAGAIN